MACTCERVAATALIAAALVLGLASWASSEVLGGESVDHLDGGRGHDLCVGGRGSDFASATRCDRIRGADAV